MSEKIAPDASVAQPSDRDAVEQVIDPEEHDLGAFTVRRLLPARRRPMVGPFIFFDRIGPAVLPPDSPMNVRPHPHIGLATLTWLYQGAIMHRDSLGFAQEIRPGEVNWMTAGSGVVHSERTPDRLKGQESPISGLQVWMALPTACEEVAPSFQHYGAGSIPTVQGDGWRATIVAGQAWGRTSPVAVYSETLFADVTLGAGATLTVPPEHEDRAVFCLDGPLQVAGMPLAPGQLAVLRGGSPVAVTAPTDAHAVLIGGAPLEGERIKDWNFVSSRRARIEQAKADWRAGRFPTVPGDDAEFIPLPEA
jgi:redox-sensitive bicupin YhaK (pirin superfamily)